MSCTRVKLCYTYINMFEALVFIGLVIAIFFLSQILNALKEYKELMPEKLTGQDVQRWEEEDLKWKMKRGPSIHDFLPSEVVANIDDMKRRYYKAQYRSFPTPQYPIYTETQLAWQDLLIERYRAEYWGFYDVIKAEIKKEIKEHAAAGKRKETFKPSHHIESLVSETLNIAKMVDPNIIVRNKMIEANIAVINGKTIDEAQKIYDNQTKKIRTFGLMIGEEGRKARAEAMEDEKERWLKDWDEIVSG